MATLLSQQRAVGRRCAAGARTLHQTRPSRCRIMSVQAEKQTATSMPSGPEQLLPALAPQLAPPPGVRMPGTSKLVDESHTFQTAAVVAFSSYLLSTASTLAGCPDPMWVPALTGASLGLLYSALHRFCHVRVWAPPRAPLRVVVTGGSKGLGKALAREFLAHGDTVVVTGRTQAALDATLADLQSEVAALKSPSAAAAGGEVPPAAPQLVVHGVVADVSIPEDVEALSAAAVELLGGVDVWVCNAGYSGGYQRFVDTPTSTMATITSTNLLGTLLCARAAGRIMAAQPGGGHLFLMDGAGSDGLATPMYTPYGATKAALPQLAASLRGELGPAGVGCHVLSPGMMLTELLLEGATVPNKQAFNLLAEHPETVAAFLVPRARAAVARAATGTYTRYLTPLSAIGRLLAAPVLMGRHFDGAGNPIYPPEHERLLGRKHAKATARRQAAARAQGAGLRLAYSLSLALSVVAFVLDGAAQAGGH